MFENSPKLSTTAGLDFNCAVGSPVPQQVLSTLVSKNEQPGAAVERFQPVLESTARLAEQVFSDLPFPAGSRREK
jgi:hypothetical protein